MAARFFTIIKVKVRERYWRNINANVSSPVTLCSHSISAESDPQKQHPQGEPADARALFFVLLTDFQINYASNLVMIDRQ